MAVSPPLSKRHLSRRLREAREATGKTADQIAEEAKEAGVPRWSASKITRAERNDWLRPRVDDVESLLDLLGVTDLADRAKFIQLTKEARQKGWWATYRDVFGSGALVGLEPGASKIRTVGVALLPGLVQSRAYAEAVIRGAGIDDVEEVQRRVEARRIRQQIIDAGQIPYWAIVDEAALRKVGSLGPEAAVEQIDHLIRIQRPNVRIQVLPDAAGMHAAITGGFTILDFELDTGLVHTEHATGAEMFEEEEDISAWELVYQYVSAAALSVPESMAFLRRMSESYQ